MRVYTFVVCVCANVYGIYIYIMCICRCLCIHRWAITHICSMHKKDPMI